MITDDLLKQAGFMPQEYEIARFLLNNYEYDEAQDSWVKIAT